MEVVIEPKYPDSSEQLIPTVLVPPEGSDSFGRDWYAGLITVTLTNHRTDRPERVIGIWTELKVRRCWFWRRTVAIGEAKVPDPQGGLPYGNPVTNLLLEPMSAPKTLTLGVGGSLKGVKLPKRSEIVLVFKMVGPIRKMQRVMTRV